MTVIGTQKCRATGAIFFGFGGSQMRFPMLEIAYFDA